MRRPPKLRPEIPFVGIDGEGWAPDKDGIQRMTLLSVSDGEGENDTIYNREGLTFKQVMGFLYEQAKTRRRFVGFYFNWDATHIISMLEEEAIQEITEHGRVTISNRYTGSAYTIEYIPGKFLTITWRRNRGARWLKECEIKIHDCGGFFQCKFVEALELFGLGTADELFMLRGLKENRATFEEQDAEEIREYNLLECKLLAQLMTIVNSHYEALGINLMAWHGAGAVASAVLKKYQVKLSMALDNPNVTLRSYYGGRVWAHQIGFFENVHLYDLKSAYPAALAGLPGTYFEPFPVEPVLHAQTASLYRVKWDLPYDQDLVPPFPVRLKDGTIQYPLTGKGWYWKPEVEAAMSAGYKVKILEAYCLQELPSRPFHFIHEWYDYRKKLIKEGDSAEICVKLALNSLYGKLAQSKGFRGFPPSFQNFIYAGLCTSITRAELLRAAVKNPRAIIAISTDGILSTEPLDLPVSDALGEWSHKIYEKAFLIKSGIYELSNRLDTLEGWHPPMVAEEIERRLRGFRSVDWQELKRIFQEQGVAGTWKEVRLRGCFIGLRTRGPGRPLGQWIDASAELVFRPSRGNAVLENLNPRRYRIIPPREMPAESKPYKIRQDPRPPDFEMDDLTDEYNGEE